MCSLSHTDKFNPLELQDGTQFLAIVMRSWPLGTTDQFLIWMHFFSYFYVHYTAIIFLFTFVCLIHILQKSIPVEKRIFISLFSVRAVSPLAEFVRTFKWNRFCKL